MSPLSWLIALSSAASAGSTDPFVQWKGLSKDGFGYNYGISAGDVDGDGWTDLVNTYGHSLWLNNAAKGWTYMEIPELSEHGAQYGGSLGDYDGDGLADLASEPRGGYAILIHGQGGGDFEKLATFPDGPPAAGGQQCETDAWIDVDGDGFLDLFVPAYYGASGLYQNLGPDGSGAYTFKETAEDAGIVLSATGSLRPEGAQFVDIDRDGDPDLYVTGELLRNQSTPGTPLFETINGGIPENGFDEGAAFADIDMDGDFDLGVFYNGMYWKGPGSGIHMGFLIWENLGDATFSELDPEAVEDYTISQGGGTFGMSFNDWDNDGDPDLSFAKHFELNQWREVGVRAFFQIETIAAVTYALPAWFDWDYDGDLDIGLGAWGGQATFVTNSLYDGTAVADRKFLRVRPVGDSPLVANGADNEFGATVDVHVVGEAPEVRRRNFTASGHGYLNQSEYTLNFGLEGLDAPVVDVSVDFVNPSEEGLWRVDKYINPALAGIDVTALALPHEIRVFRSGRVDINGTTYEPVTDEAPLLETPGGLALTGIGDDLDSVETGTWVGLEVKVPTDADRERGAAIREVVVDGVLGEPAKCAGASGNVLVWDVTHDEAELVGGATGPVLLDNRRVDVPTDFELQNGHTYRVLAHVTDDRPFAPAKSASWLTVTGALEIVPTSPCDATEIAGALAEDDTRVMAVRWRERIVESDREDTGDSGDTGTTTDDSGKPKDDSGTTNPKDTGWGVFPGGNDDPDDTETASGCGCASGSNSSTGLWLLLGLPLVARRRRSSGLLL